MDRNQLIFELLRHFMPNLLICKFQNNNNNKKKKNIQQYHGAVLPLEVAVLFERFLDV